MSLRSIAAAAVVALLSLPVHAGLITIQTPDRFYSGSGTLTVQTLQRAGNFYLANASLSYVPSPFTDRVVGYGNWNGAVHLSPTNHAFGECVLLESSATESASGAQAKFFCSDDSGP